MKYKEIFFFHHQERYLLLSCISEMAYSFPLHSDKMLDTNVRSESCFGCKWQIKFIIHFSSSCCSLCKFLRKSVCHLYRRLLTAVARDTINKRVLTSNKELQKHHFCVLTWGFVNWSNGSTLQIVLWPLLQEKYSLPTFKYIMLVDITIVSCVLTYPSWHPQMQPQTGICNSRLSFSDRTPCSQQHLHW